jgi:rod shape-determining protein MreD
MLLLDAAKAAAVVFVAAILQVSVFSDVTILHGTPDLLLVAIICTALLRGPIVGAAIGFWGGLLLDTANLGTLGVTSLLLTVAGYWIGRYGETTGRDRAHAPFVSVAVITFLYALGSLTFHFVLGEAAPARTVLWTTLFQGIALNLILTWPLYRLARFLLPQHDRWERLQRAPAVG